MCRLERLERRGIARPDAEARMAAQASDDERRAAADIVIDNSGDLAALEDRVNEAWAEIERRAARKHATE